ncbi:hypothetical protein TNCV_3010821 [Trichonephila clavipes]|nr:hypothetical protein TNCV_3010821 [Trichonephila clavipes]
MNSVNLWVLFGSGRVRIVKKNNCSQDFVPLFYFIPSMGHLIKKKILRWYKIAIHRPAVFLPSTTFFSPPVFSLPFSFLPWFCLVSSGLPCRCQVLISLYKGPAARSHVYGSTCCQFGLAIHQNDHQARRRFVEWAQNEIAVVLDFHKRILFSDEAHFWLNGYVNKQSCRIWSEANPQVYVETPLHPEKLTVWCALWAGGILLQKQ